MAQRGNIVEASEKSAQRKHFPDRRLGQVIRVVQRSFSAGR